MPLPQDLESNPLVQPFTLPNGAPPLDKVRIKHFLPAITHGIALAKAEIEAIKNNPEPPTFENTIVALDNVGEVLGRATSVFGLFSASKSSPEIRNLEKKTGPLLSAFSSGIYQDAGLFRRVEAVYKDASFETLDPDQKILVRDTYRSFEKNGIALPPEQQARFREISKRLSVLSSKFSDNVLEATEAFKLFIDDEKRLEGLPDRVKDEYRQNAAKAGKPDQWLIVLQPHPSEVLTHAKDRTLREEVYRGLWNVAYGENKYDNRLVILEMMALKHELARMMGYETTADFILSDAMAKDAKTVNAFLERNLAAYKPAAESYLDGVRAFAKFEDGLDNLKSWDVAYYGRALKEKLFSVDPETIRPYFELKSTFNDLANHFGQMFGAELRPAGKKYPVHNKDVTVYEVFNKASNSFVGLFYANYYAKPGMKRGGAWMGEIRGGGFNAAGLWKTPVVTNDCNYKKLDGGKPTLLTIDNKRTDFHEAGHGAHGLFTRVRYQGQAGTRVKRDWVELPSQLQEGWVMAKARDRSDPFGTHHETGEKIPLDLLDRIEEMNRFDAGYIGLRQTFLGMLDMKWHTTDPSTMTSVEDVEDGVVAVASLMPREVGTISTAFTHLFAGGYAAGYYGYKWADVMAADVFEKSQERGVMYDAPFLARVRETIYETGGSRDPAELYRELMGRDPDPDALFRREGLVPKP